MLVGIAGFARVGKDAAAQALVGRGYVRLSFADKLRHFLLALDPIVYATAMSPYRLSDIVGDIGWEQAKDDFPEVRALLQRCGTEAGRKVLGENVWVDAVLRDLPEKVVIPDVRFPNEAQAIKERGGRVFRITRPDYGPVNDHPSETALAHWQFDRHIVNDGDLGDLCLSICEAVR